MLDLETLGTRAGGKILQIAAVRFDANGLHEEFDVVIDRWSQGTLTEDLKTRAWWAQQDPAVHAKVFGGQVPINAALRQFDQWLRSIAPERPDKPGTYDVKLWGNGADFDNVYLLGAYSVIWPDATVCWSFRGHRCFRTLKSLKPDLPLERVGAHHDALDDAKTQALHAIKVYKALGC
jgi:hypothetical protein